MSETEERVSTEQVEAFLLGHPEFFHDHLSLLEKLSIPHPSGQAVSLISKQLEIFRSKHHELENQLNALIEIARENDTAFNRMHELTLAMLDAGTMEELIANLNQVMTECFMTDYVALKIIGENVDSPILNLFVQAEDGNLKHFQQEMSENRPKCGRPTLAQARFLFGENAGDVQTCAIIPMVFTELEGILAIGSRDNNRFHYSLGNMFLTQMSEIISTRMISLLDQ